MCFFQAWIIESSVVEGNVVHLVEVEDGSDSRDPSASPVRHRRHVHREARTDRSVEDRHVNPPLTCHYKRWKFTLLDKAMFRSQGNYTNKLQHQVI